MLQSLMFGLPPPLRVLCSPGLLSLLTLQAWPFVGWMNDLIPSSKQFACISLVATSSCRANAVDTLQIPYESVKSKLLSCHFSEMTCLLEDSLMLFNQK